ncbi:DNA-binding MarR family transcriptional regulator [Breoghania corrubedonensis]|uniref:DNA-binding MarR family transcriptional regulator n=1 Tax=Breoghania corrubedonensis TaxID=665038 RepID=A0A2T5V913_9HYPH|nr:MarR family winged helix-turn-helix transcriptional regulator [Breoghania corrubedonensis]PTW60243.1 DNA-binding MarR family transcriptional regulator [Breoghania corrubedonensis]
MVQNTHLSDLWPGMHEALIDIIAVMNRPARDEELLSAAGLTLERALFPLLIAVAKRGPIGVVELADGVGRDHTTVSRQVSRLEELGLVARQVAVRDRRVREVVVTDKGRALSDRIDTARLEIARRIFSGWSDADFAQLAVLLRRFADAMSG